MPEIPLLVDEYFAAQAAVVQLWNRLNGAIRPALVARFGDRDLQLDTIERLTDGRFLVSYYRYGYPGMRYGEGSITLTAAELRAWVSGEAADA